MREMKEGRRTTVQTSPAGGEHPPGVHKQLQTDPLKEKKKKKNKKTTQCRVFKQNLGFQDFKSF